MANEIFIENLPLKVDASMLINIFKREGRIISCNIVVDRHLASLGKGCIIFDNPSSAYHAVKIMDGQNFHGGKIKVSLKPRNISDDETMIDNYTKVFVKNIPPHWDDCDLMVEFRKFGDIKAAQISMTSGKSNYFGFVIFNQHSSAKTAVMSKYSYLIVRPYIPKPIRNRTTSSDSVEDILEKSTQYNNLYVKNIPEDMDDSALEELFEKFGTITSVKVARDQISGKSLKFGFVCFVSETDAEEARSAMNGYILNSKQLVVNFHQKKEARKQFLEKRNFSGATFEGKGIRRDTEAESPEKDTERKRDIERVESKVKRKENERKRDIEKVESKVERKENDSQTKVTDSQTKVKDVTRKIKGVERKEEATEKIEKGTESNERKVKNKKKKKGAIKK